MKKLLILVAVLLAGCSLGPQRQDYQVFMNEKVESPFFYVPPLNQKDYEKRTWVLLAESQSKIWFYDPYTLTQDEDGIVSYDAFFKPREKNSLAPFNPTLVGPYRQKIDCFGNNQWSETFYIDRIPPPSPAIANVKPINGSGWVKIAPRTAMAYVRTRLCGRKFLDEQNINFFLYQDGFMAMPQSRPDPSTQAESKVQKPDAPVLKAVETQDTNPQKTPLVYEVINNEVQVLDPKKDVRQMRVGAYSLSGYFPKKAEYLFTANCQDNSYSLIPQGVGDKSSGMIAQKDSLAAIAFNRACGNHGSYMKLVNKFSK
jgi:hypothetical protein